MDIDKALDVVGGYRRWHITIFILLGVSLFLPLCWQGLAIVFTGWEPPHWCRLDSTLNGMNDTSIPEAIDDDSGRSKCTMYTNSSLTGQNISACTNGWTYDNQGYYTIVEQWDLVCQHNYLSEVSMTTYHVGCLIAEIAFSYLVDRYGRKMVHIISHMLICVVGIGIAFSNTYITFVILRTILGMITVACVNSGLTELMELFDSKRRAFAGIGLEFQWVFCYLTLPVLTYYIGDWRTLQIVMSLTSAIWIIYFWILPESPIWLVAAGRFDEAERILHKIARWNGVPISPNTQLLNRPDTYKAPLLPDSELKSLEKLEQQREKEEEADGDGRVPSVPPAVSISSLSKGVAAVSSRHMAVPVLDLLRDKYMRLYIVICSLLWLANCLVYYGLILSIPSLAGNRFINFLIMGFVELPAVFLALYTTEKCGRRIPTAVYHIAAGIPLTIVIFIPNTTASGISLSPLVVTLVMVSKFAISASFSVVILYSKELFPTNLRGTSSGICQVLGRIGSIVAPFAAYLTKTSYYWLPNVLFGAVSIGAGFLTLFLPETSGHPLPQTLDDVHRVQANQPRGSCFSSSSSSLTVQKNGSKRNTKDAEAEKEEEPSTTDALINDKVPQSERRDL